MLTLIDAHVHVHDPQQAAELLDAAEKNFASVARDMGRPQWQGVLMLAEMKQASWFESITSCGPVVAGDWTIEADGEDATVLRARRNGADRELLAIAGRQVVTREGVEVLTLATRARIPDGESMQRTLERAAAEQALIVLPWGAGKWLGRRGRLVRNALARQRPAVWAGDTGSRPMWWPAGREFRLTSPFGTSLVSGTDPLPLDGESRRVGSFGCWLAGLPPASMPGTWLRERLRSAGPAQLQPYGRPMGSMSFMQRQIALRTRGRRATHPASISSAAMQGATPDIETSSASYARRFSGPAGRYLLQVQSGSIARVLRDLPPGRALDVGGGHGQLVPLLRRLGWNVTVHGTDAACERNLRNLHGQHDCAFLLGGLFDLPAADRSFDLVIAVRLISHVDEWEKLVAEMCRVARHAVVIDYPSSGGLNALTPLLFGLKKSLEGNTRTYTSFSRARLVQAFGSHGFGRPRQVKQFFLPMVLHRMGKGILPLRALEKLCRLVGLTALAGSPVILRVDRQDTAERERG